MAKICTWNVNGIRSRNNLGDAFSTIDADVICIQETRINKEQIDENIAFVNKDYYACFSIPTKFKGRAGCATYYRDHSRPYDAEYEFPNRSEVPNKWDEHISDLISSEDIKDLNSEGRLVITCHGIKISENLRKDSDDDGYRKLYIINAYFPHLEKDKDDRRIFKEKFNKMIEAKTRFLLNDEKSHVLVACDLNIKHHPIDSVEPLEDSSEIYVSWLDSYLSPREFSGERHMVDAFRHLYPKARKAFTCWKATIPNSRLLNFGYRIDLIMTDSELIKYIRDVVHLKDIMGSDHCPVMVELRDVSFVASKEHPPGSARLWPKFEKRQTSLKRFFPVQSKTSSDCNPEFDVIKPRKKTKLAS